MHVGVGKGKVFTISFIFGESFHIYSGMGNMTIIASMQYF